MEKTSKGKKRIVVGITSRAPEINSTWLKEFLTNEFHSLISEVRYLPISNNPYWKEEVKKCSVVIIHHTNIQGRAKDKDLNVEFHDLDYLSKTLGREKLLVLFDDLDDNNEEMRERIQRNQPALFHMSFLICLIPRTNKCNVAEKNRAVFSTLLSEGMRTSYWQDSRSFPITYPSATTRSTFTHIDQDPRQTQSMNTPSPGPRYQISIFSMSAKSSYTWLVNKMKEDKRLKSAEIKSVYFKNDQTFHSELSKCQFAILYHSQKQGRINITNVEDALYDKELQDLSTYLGMNKVIVVIDDMKDVSSKEKEQILKNQPSIRKSARDLFLFKVKEKSSDNLNKIASLIVQSLQNQPVQDNGLPHEHTEWQTKRNSVTSVPKRVSPSYPSIPNAGNVHIPNTYSHFQSDSEDPKLNNQAEFPTEITCSMAVRESLQRNVRSQNEFPFSELDMLITEASDKLGLVQQAVKAINKFSMEQQSQPKNLHYSRNDSVMTSPTNKESRVAATWEQIREREYELHEWEKTLQKKEQNLNTKIMMIQRKEMEQQDKDKELREREEKVKERELINKNTNQGISWIKRRQNTRK